MNRKVFVLLIFAGVLPLNEGFCLFGWFRTCKPKPVEYKAVTDVQAKQYLENYGYLKPSSSLNNPSFASSDNFESALKSTFNMAVKAFQEFAQLKVTGELNDETKKKMAQPRCGVADIKAMGSTRDIIAKWKKSHLKYAILNDPGQKLLPAAEIKKALQAVFEKWSEVVPLTFSETSATDSDTDIKIKFVKGSHGDPWPFDGKGGAYAHATMPQSGLLHFDAEENWVYNKPDKLAKGVEYIDFLKAAFHAVGDVLGVPHVRDPEAIMSPFYKRPLNEQNGEYVPPRLHNIDVEAAKKLYSKDQTSDSSRIFEMDKTKGCTGRNCHGWEDVRDRTSTPSSRERTFAHSWDEDVRSQTAPGAHPRRPTTISWDYEDARAQTAPGARHQRPTTASWNDDEDVRHRTSTFSPPSRGSFGSSDRLGGLSSFGGHGLKGADLDSGRGGSRGGSFSGGHSACLTSLDAVTPGLDSSTVYIFQDTTVYELRNGRVVDSSPIQDLFPRGPRFVEAAFANPTSESIMLFNGGEVYAYHKRGSGYELDRDFPKTLPRDIGFSPSGAMLWVDGHQLLFSKGGDFAIYDEYWNQATKVDKISNYFEGLPLGAKGGISESGDTLTVFTAHQVFHYDARGKRTTGQPESLASYLKCF